MTRVMRYRLNRREMQRQCEWTVLAGVRPSADSLTSSRYYGLLVAESLVDYGREVQPKGFA
jgi:hypothetical protein